MTPVNIADVTTVPAVDSNCVTVGTGSFDVLMESVNLQINKQWELGRITGADFASVYLGALQAVLQQSIQFTLSAAKADAEVALLEQKLATEKTNTEDPVAGAAKDKKDLMAAQSLGFANNTKQSVLKTMLDGYSTNLAIAGVANVPESTLDGAIDQLSQNILDSLTTTNEPVRVQIQTVTETADVDTGT